LLIFCAVPSFNVEIVPAPCRPPAQAGIQAIRAKQLRLKKGGKA